MCQKGDDISYLTIFILQLYFCYKYIIITILSDWYSQS